MLPHHLFEVPDRRRAVEHPAATIGNQEMQLAIDLKLQNLGTPGHDRTIHEGVEIRRQVGIRFTWKRRERCVTALPAGRQGKGNFMGPDDAVGKGDESGGAIQQREPRLHPVGSDAHFPGVDAVCDRDTGSTGGCHPPPVLGHTLDGRCRAGRAQHRDALDMAREFPNQIGARRPHGHHQLDLGLSVGRNGYLYLDAVRMGRWEAERVAQRLSRFGLCGCVRHEVEIGADESRA